MIKGGIMFPVVFSVGSFAIHSYGLLLALSFLVGVSFASSRAKKMGLVSGVVSDVSFWIILSAIIGARLYYVFLHFEEFSGNYSAIFNPFQGGSIGIGGLVMYGGLIGAIFGGFIFFRIHRVPFLPYADAIAPTLGIGIFFTRIGCFLNGCCYGMPTESSIGVKFPIMSPAGQYQVHMHANALIPSQLFLSAGGILLAVIVILAAKKIKFEGFQFYLAGAIYSVIRFFVDFTRFYGADERLFGLSHNQIVCIIIFVVFSGLILKNLIMPTAPDSDEKSIVTPETETISDSDAD